MVFGAAAFAVALAAFSFVADAAADGATSRGRGDREGAEEGEGDSRLSLDVDDAAERPGEAAAWVSNCRAFFMLGVVTGHVGAVGLERHQERFWLGGHVGARQRSCGWLCNKSKMRFSAKNVSFSASEFLLLSKDRNRAREMFF